MQMKKIIIGSLLSIAMSVSLSAAVYATVDGTEITDKDIASLLRSMPGADFNQMNADQKGQIINQAIERELLAKKAIEDGIEKDPEFQKMLEGSKADLALEVWMKKAYEDIEVSDKAAKEYFEKNKDSFVKPASVKARHILLESEQAANEVINELKGLSGEALTEKFSALAKEKSTGPSGENGGDLGWFNKKQMVKPFADAAFALSKGSITTEPVQTQFGYHVILTEDKKGGEKVTFEEAKDQIVNGLKMEKFRQKVSKEAAALKEKANIVIK